MRVYTFCMKKIGIVGTGIMGNGIAVNYLKKGYVVFVWNRTKSKLDSLSKLGAVAAATPREVAEKADIVFEVTGDDTSSKAVWLGEDGILAGPKADSVLISSATISVEWTDELAKLCTGKGYTFFDMPMTGSRAGAEGGKLTFLVGGDQEALERLKPDLAAVSEKQMLFGKTGSGIRYKLLLNMLAAIHIVGLGEALKIAQKNGMDVKKVGDALAEKPGGVTTNLAWRDYQRAPEPINFSVEWAAKDLDYARAFTKGMTLPLLDDVRAAYREAIKKGIAQSDWTAVNKK